MQNMSSSAGNGVANGVNCPDHLETLFGLYGGSKLPRMTAASEERAALLALMEERPTLRGENAGKTSWSTIASEVSMLGSAIKLWEQFHPPAVGDDDYMFAFDDIRVADDSDLQLEQAMETVRSWEKASDFDVVTVLDIAYPLALREIHQMPPVLFAKGELRVDEVGVSVVGTRKPTELGRSIATNVAKGLVDRQISVISGLAAGIDAAAHEATLDAGGRPVGVIGTGINKVYPVPHRELHERVAAAGLLVSQFFPDAPPTKHSFPMRNVTMSGLGRASVIVEAGEHSGTRIQARVAVEHGRPVILTDLVVKATKWGKALRDRPGVYVASGTADVMGIVEQLVSERPSRRDDLAPLASTLRRSDLA
jgi:DNA protecting protein DprA